MWLSHDRTWISNAMHVVFFMLNPQALVSIHGKIDYQCIKYALIVDLPMDRNKCLWLNHMVWVRSVFSFCWYWWNNWLLISLRFDFQRNFLLCISSIALIKLSSLASFLIFELAKNHKSYGSTAISPVGIKCQRNFSFFSWLFRCAKFPVAR